MHDSYSQLCGRWGGGYEILRNAALRIYIYIPAYACAHVCCCEGGAALAKCILDAAIEEYEKTRNFLSTYIILCIND